MTPETPRFDRIIWIVLDSVGIGELPDANDYGDVGRDTLGHIARSRPLRIPNLQRLGIGNIAPLVSITPPEVMERAPQNPREKTLPLVIGKWRASGSTRPFRSIRMDSPSTSFRSLNVRLGAAHWATNRRRELRSSRSWVSSTSPPAFRLFTPLATAFFKSPHTKT